MAFTCNYCNKNFSEKRSLIRHIKSKHEVTNLRCKKCEFTSDRLDCLKRHIESKHYQNKIKCPECSVEFGRKDSMEKHRKEFHPKDPFGSDGRTLHSYCGYLQYSSNCNPCGHPSNSFCGPHFYYGPYTISDL